MEDKEATTESKSVGIWSWGWWKVKIRSAGSHISLLLLLILYTSLGAKVFQVLEYEVESAGQLSMTQQVQEKRQHLISQLLTLGVSADSGGQGRLPGTWPQQRESQTLTSDWDKVSAMVREYEEVVEDGQRWGVSPLNPQPPTRWTYTQALFFSATVLTTIGYGNIAPSTVGGRVFCVGFALVGIPLTLAVIANMGDVLASLLPAQAIENILPKGRLRTVASVGSLLLLLLAYLTAGACLFMLLEVGWSFTESFYFCFITTSTIGFGDLVPTGTSLLYLTAYILVGLALTSMVLELVRRKYADSWAKVRLSARLQTLSGPLATALRRLGETGTGEISVDAALVEELKQLDEVMGLTHTDHSWTQLITRNNKKRNITILMYESNV